MKDRINTFLNVCSLSKQFKNYCINPNGINEHERYLCFNYCKPLENNLKEKDINYFEKDNFIIIDMFNIF